MNKDVYIGQVLLGEIGKVDNIAYNSFAYSVYDTFDMNKPSHQ